MTLLYKANAARGLVWRAVLADVAPDLPVRLWPDIGDPAAIRYLVAWQPPERFADFPNLELVFSAGAGADQFDASSLPPHVPLIRMVEPGQVDAMVDYVTLAVLAIHRNLPAYVDQQRRGVWATVPIRPASARRVGILGLGQMGRPAAERLRAMGFPVSGWSRTGGPVEGIACFAGERERDAFLRDLDILVCLLPLTDETRGILDASLFARLPVGAAIVNAGRGGHLVTGDLIDALDREHLSAAILDVVDPEPPPPDHPFWDHPRIMMTPHIASISLPEDAVAFVVATIARHKAGDKLIGQVDPGLGY